MKLLVLGENATHRRSLSRALASIGYEEIAEVSTELEARRHIQARFLDGTGVDLVLIRWDSTDGGPLLLAPWMRATPGYSKLPVMVISERAMPGDVVRASQYGASDYLLSPFDLETLKGKLEALASSGGTPPQDALMEAAYDSPAISEPASLDKNGPDLRPRSRILVVEDQESTRALIGVMLREEFELVFAADLQQAVYEALRRSFAAVTIDINLERDSGLDLLEVLRGLPAYQPVPKIAVTAFAMPGDRERLLSLGFDGYVSKPFRKQDLLDVIRKTIGESSAVSHRTLQ